MAGTVGSLVTLLCLSLSSTIALARPVAYGEHFIRLGEVLPGTGAVQEDVPAPDLVASQDSYRLQMQEMELRDGPYADALAEPLAAMGNAYRRQGEFEAALASYRRALHVVRVNDGLYSERQIPVLRELLLTFRETGDYEALDQRYEYFFRLYGQGKPPYTELRLRAALEYLRWQREALLLDLDGDAKRRLLGLITLNGDLVDAVLADPNSPYSWKRDFTQSQLRNFYLLQSMFTPRLQEIGLVAYPGPFGANPAGADLEDQRFDHLLRTVPGKGRFLIEQLEHAAALQGPLEQASLQLSLADWHQWNGGYQQADRAYRQVVEVLQQEGATELLQQWLGEPVELPANGALLRPADASDDEPASIRARFDVSTRGRVSNVSTEAVSGDVADELVSFRRRLSATLFRPRWDSGKPQASENLERDYRLID
jgi:tetratricopeptide (TPR) repeat protein